MCFAIISSVYCGERVARCECLVEAQCSKVFADGLQWIGEGLADAAWGARGCEQLPSIGSGPESQQWLNARHGGGTGRIIRNQRKIAQSQILAQPLVVCEHERPVRALR